MRYFYTIVFVLLSTIVFGQGFTYSYVDPCSKELKTLQITNSQLITVNYLGNINSFNSTDFSNGVFDNWINQITQAAADQPCDELLTNTQSSQNMFITQNLISTLTSITAASTMTASNAVANSVSNSTSNGGTGGGKKNNKNNNGSNNSSSSDNQSNTSTGGTGNNSQGNISNGSSTQGGGNNTGGNVSGSSTTGGGNNSQGGTTNQGGGSTSVSGGSSTGGNGTTQRGVNNQGSSSGGNNNNPSPVGGRGSSEGNNPQGGVSGDGTTKQTETSGSGNGGTTNSVANAAEASSSGSGGGKGGRANVGSIIGTGDIVAIRVNEDKSNQFRGTMSMTHSNTNNTRAKGFLLNYTTTVRNSNLTLYGAFTNPVKKRVFIVANSSMVDFDKNFFNTTTALESKTFGKTSFMGGLNFTVGGLGGEMFTNLSAVGGGFHPFKINQNLSGNILLLGVYSPFTKFYEGKWWDSGWLIVPFSSWDYAISKNFKYNVSLSGTYEVKGNFLQFQILTGGKILL